MRSTTLLTVGFAGSMLAHATVLSVLSFSVSPDPPPAQPSPESRLVLGNYRVDQQDLQARATNGDDTTTTTPHGAKLGAGAIARLHLKTRRPAGQDLSSSVLRPASLKARPVTGKTTKSSPPKTTTVTGITHLPSVHLDQTVPAPDLIRAKPAVFATSAALAAPVIAANSLSATGEQTQTSPSKGDILPAQTLPAVVRTAALAWEFADRVITDPKSLSVIQAFMAPGDLASSATNTGDVRDSLTDILASVDCARVSATFIPETGALELRGHVPDNAARAPVLLALQAQIGDGITVTDNLLQLPRPQCAALSAIASVGLAQSTDQLTNSRLIGKDAHVREYGFYQGQKLSFDLTAPDYDAVVYVDYFDANGNVIHLVPNTQVPLVRQQAKSTFGVGAARDGRPGLDITIGPPYGQEITVAFAASTPIFKELRPLVEPAETYLEDMKLRISKLRDSSPDFKGEWVYFFVTTAPATQ